MERLIAQFMYHIRRIRIQDLGSSHALEIANFSNPWNYRDISTYALDKFVNIANNEAERTVDEERSAFVATDLHHQIGHVFYRYFATDNYIRITNLSIDRHYRRQKVGTGLLVRILGEAEKKKAKIIALVRETNLATQLLFKKCDYTCVATIDNCYADTKEPGYLFAITRFHDNEIMLDHTLYELLEGD